MAMALPKIEQEQSNIIQLRVVNGSIEKKNEKKYNKDGSEKKTRCNKKAGESSEVYPFTDEEQIDLMVKVFEQHIIDADTLDHERIARRNKMLFILGINISIRGSDICELKWSDFFYDDYTMKEGTKIQPIKTRRTGKYVTLAFNQAVQDVINEYVSLYPINDLSDYIFPSRKGGSISRMSAGRIIKDAAKEAGLKQNVNSHSLRKTFGYHVWHNAEDKQKALVMLQFIFGHSSVTDTMKYIGIVKNDIEDTFNSISLGYKKDEQN